MPSTPPPDGSPRSADAVNADIRALWTHPDARLTDEQREKYRQLLAELRQVERGDVTTAA
jgi:Mor family transcriptional regulator